MGYSVYRLTSPNGKVYIGITKRDPKIRWANGKGYYQNRHLYAAILKYGWDNFAHDVLVTDLEKSTACKLEEELVALYRSNDPRFGYNNSVGGEAPSKGRKQSPEEIAKRVAAIKSKPMSERGRQNISRALKGKPSKARGKVGKECMQAGVVYQIDRETKNVVCVYYGYPEMARKTGFARTPVMEAANGIRKQAYGFEWAYKKRRDADVSV